MDPSQLLNTNTPFDESKLALLEQVINVFYTTINNQERQMANKLLDQFQKLDISFQYCEFILNRTQSNNTRVLLKMNGLQLGQILLVNYAPQVKVMLICVIII